MGRNQPRAWGNPGCREATPRLSGLSPLALSPGYAAFGIFGASLTPANAGDGSRVARAARHSAQGGLPLRVQRYSQWRHSPRSRAGSSRTSSKTTASLPQIEQQEAATSIRCRWAVLDCMNLTSVLICLALVVVVVSVVVAVVLVVVLVVVSGLSGEPSWSSIRFINLHEPSSTAR